MTLSSIKSAIAKTLEIFNIAAIRHDRLCKLFQENNTLSDPRAAVRRIDFILTPEQEAWVRNSRSQLFQDLFVLSRLNFKKNGFFVEFGATDGRAISNTYLLEKDYSWTGILAEPGRRWHPALRANRNCFIDEKCVWRDTGSTLSFKETNDAEFSTITQFLSIDGHKKTRESGCVYDVSSISLTDLLNKYHAPKEIDYLSVDTEGSEYEILSHFDYSDYRFNVITCEHNYTPARQKIFDLLTSHGYRRCFENASLWDDWYVREE